jgi:hypothetical protein
MKYLSFLGLFLIVCLTSLKAQVFQAPVDGAYEKQI